jgi:hypothetical protein
MNERLKMLAGLTLRGNERALAELFDKGAGNFDAGRFREAAEAYREAATKLRLEAGDMAARVEKAERALQGAARMRDAYKAWIDAHPSGIQPLPYDARGFGWERIQEVLVSDMPRDPLGSVAIRLLATALEARGVEFYSPGGSVLRRSMGMLRACFGFGRPEDCPHVEDRDVRIALDILADAIRDRLQHGDPAEPAAASRTGPAEPG